MLARTVTRALARSSMPSLAMAATTGVSMTLGLTLHLHGLEHVAAGQVDGRRALKDQGDVRALGGDERVDHAVDVAAGQVMGLQLVDGDVQARLGGLDQRVDDAGRG